MGTLPGMEHLQACKASPFAEGACACTTGHGSIAAAPSLLLLACWGLLVSLLIKQLIKTGFGLSNLPGLNLSVVTCSLRDRFLQELRTPAGAAAG